MAWPKLRSRKSPGRLVTQSSHSGAAPDGAQSYGAAPNGAAPNSAGNAPETGEPAVWPGVGAVAEPSPAADPPAADPEVPEEADEGPSFLDWAPAEDPVDLDDLQDPSAAQVRAKLSEREPRDETIAMRSRAP